MEILWINLWIEHKVNKGVNNKSILIWSLHIYCNCNNCFKLQFSSVAQSCLTAIPWTTACQASLSITNSWSLFKLMSIELVMPSNSLILCHPLLLLPSIFLQHHNSKASILRCSAFFIVQLSHPYMTAGKTIALTRRTFVDKVMSLLFNMMSRLLIREGNGNPLQYSCLENPMDGGAWLATVHGVAEGQPWLST